MFDLLLSVIAPIIVVLIVLSFPLLSCRHQFWLGWLGFHLLIRVAMAPSTPFYAHTLTRTPRPASERGGDGQDSSQNSFGAGVGGGVRFAAVESLANAFFLFTVISFLRTTSLPHLPLSITHISPLPPPLLLLLLPPPLLSFIRSLPHFN